MWAQLNLLKTQIMVLFVCPLFFFLHLFVKLIEQMDSFCLIPLPLLACPITGMEPGLTHVNHRSRVTPNSLQGFYLSCFTQMFGNTDAKRDWFKMNHSVLILLSAYVCVCLIFVLYVCAYVCVYWRMQKHYSDAEIHDHLSQDLFKKAVRYINI